MGRTQLDPGEWLGLEGELRLGEQDRGDRSGGRSLVRVARTMLWAVSKYRWREMVAHSGDVDPWVASTGPAELALFHRSFSRV
jgi:hypothetical protein